jgi:flagellar biosynthesis protein FlhG
MRDFYATSTPTPLDQADGLRRMFAARRCRVLALAANPHVAFGGVVLDRVAAGLEALGREVLVVDAAAGAPAPHELAALDLAAGIERVSERVGYLPARGLPLRFVDTRGSAAGFLDALQAAAPLAGAMLVHADAAELARLFARRAMRPLLLAADHPESLKHAYASAKLLVQRSGLATFDLLLAAGAQSPRLDRIVSSLEQCAERFLGALLCDWALVDPAGDPGASDDGLEPLLRAQLALDADTTAPTAAWAPAPVPHPTALGATRAAERPAARPTLR